MAKRKENNKIKTGGEQPQGVGVYRELLCLVVDRLLFRVCDVGGWCNGPGQPLPGWVHGQLYKFEDVSSSGHVQRPWLYPPCEYDIVEAYRWDI